MHLADYARQSGAITLDSADYLHWTQDTRVNDMAFWLENGASPEALPSRRIQIHQSTSGSVGLQAAQHPATACG